MMPRIWQGSLIERLHQEVSKMLKPLHNLDPEEAAVLVLLGKKLGEESARSRGGK